MLTYFVRGCPAILLIPFLKTESLLFRLFLRPNPPLKMTMELIIIRTVNSEQALNQKSITSENQSWKCLPGPHFRGKVMERCWKERLPWWWWWSCSSWWIWGGRASWWGEAPVSWIGKNCNAKGGRWRFFILHWTFVNENGDEISHSQYLGMGTQIAWTGMWRWFVSSKF